MGADQSFRRMMLQDDDDIDLAENEVRNRPTSLEHLMYATSYSRNELQLLYRGFKEVPVFTDFTPRNTVFSKACPRGVICLDEFVQHFYTKWFPNEASSDYAKHVFRTFDINGDGMINFEELVTGLSVLTKGTNREKLDWIFQLYDIDQDGKLSQGDVFKTVISIHEILGPFGDPPISAAMVANHTKYVFEKFDINSKGYITIDDFVRACRADDTICESLNLFDTVLRRRRGV